jgi:hypothetical protein
MHAARAAAFTTGVKPWVAVKHAKQVVSLNKENQNCRNMDVDIQLEYLRLCRLEYNYGRVLGF